MQELQEFRLGKATFVAGLLWSALATREVKKEVAQLAREVKATHYVVRTGESDLFAGFCELPKALAGKGVYSAAAIVSKKMEIEGVKDFLFAAELENERFLYVAQRDGVLLPDGDCIDKADAVMSRLLGDLGMHNWQAVVAPDHWGVATRHFTFEDCLIERAGQRVPPKWARLASLQRDLRPALAAGALIAVAGLGAYWWDQEQERQRILEQMRVASMQQAAPVVVEHPWKEKPLPRDLALACLDAFTAGDSWYVPGWTLTTFGCTPSGASVEWEREDGGRLSLLEEAIGNVHVANDGKSARLEVPYRVSLPSGRDEQLLAVQAASGAVIRATEQFGLHPTLAVPPPAPALPGQPEPAVQAPWTEVSVALQETALDPSQSFSEIDVPGLRLDQITAKFNGPGSLSWSYFGVLYAKP